MKRACIFVDGENFRHSLKALFAHGRYSFRPSRDYLPKSNWHHFFTSIANRFDCELLRTYWYVVDAIDCQPYSIPHEWRPKAKILGRWYAERIATCTTDEELHDVLTELEDKLEKTRTEIQKRALGWKQVQAAIENTNDQLEFRPCGSIRYELATRQFGTEKGVDTQLTTDMIEFANMYDVAIILSGDADYLPPVNAVKRKGRLVYSVSFLNRGGRKLPGGARRLCNAVDARLELNFEAVRTGLSIEKLPENLRLDGTPEDDEEEIEAEAAGE